MKHQHKILVLSALLSVCATVQVNAAVITAAVEYALSDTVSDSRAFTLGYKFTTSEALSVNALGYWDDGLGNNHQVGIWDSVGNLLTSTTVLGTDTGPRAFSVAFDIQFQLGRRRLYHRW